MNRCRHQAFSDIHRELGRPLEPDQTCLATRGWTEKDFDKMDPLCGDLLDRGADAVVTDTDFTACMLIRSLRRRGVRVPDDVAVVGWGDEEMAAWHDPPLTTTSYEFRQVADAALDLLTDWIENPAGGDHPSRTVPMKLIVRESA